MYNRGMAKFDYPVCLLYPKVHSLSDLLALYESNFHQLLNLIPDFQYLPNHSVYKVRKNLVLHLKLIETCRYTTTVFLTYRFIAADKLSEAPNLKLRVYHDTRQVEVLSCEGGRSLANMRDDGVERRSPLIWKWEINHFLNKWLMHCIDEGYRFYVRDFLRHEDPELLSVQQLLINASEALED